MKKDIPKQHRRLLEAYGCYLHELRFCHGLTQELLHTEVGISRRSIINAEKGRSTNLIHFLQLSDYYGLSITDLLQSVE